MSSTLPLIIVGCSIAVASLCVAIAKYRENRKLKETPKEVVRIDPFARLINVDHELNVRRANYSAILTCINNMAKNVTIDHSPEGVCWNISKAEATIEELDVALTEFSDMHIAFRDPHKVDPSSLEVRSIHGRLEELFARANDYTYGANIGIGCTA